MERGKSVKRIVLEWAVTLLIGLLIALFITQVLIVNAQVPTGSMEPTININDRVIGLRQAYRFGDIERGDLIIFRYPDNEKELYVKRVIGLPGDMVEIVDGEVFLNESSEPLYEPYLKQQTIGDFGPYEVPLNSYFVLGDNRNNSWDSRYWDNTFVHEDKIIGKAWIRLFPNPTVLQ